MEKPKNPPTPEEVISSENNNQRTPNTVGGTLPPTAPECLEAPKESGLLRSLGRRVLGCLWPDEKQKIEDTDARTPAPQPSSESVDDARSLEDEGDEAYRSIDRHDRDIRNRNRTEIMSASTVAEPTITRDVADQLTDFDRNEQDFLADLYRRVERFEKQVKEASRVPLGLREQNEGAQTSTATFVDNPPIFPYIFDED